MKWFGRREPVEVDEIRAKASKRLTTMQTADLIPWCEAQLGTTWRLFDQFQGKPDGASLGEYSTAVRVLAGGVDVLQKRFER